MPEFSLLPRLSHGPVPSLHYHFSRYVIAAMLMILTP